MPTPLYPDWILADRPYLRSEAVFVDGGSCSRCENDGSDSGTSSVCASVSSEAAVARARGGGIGTCMSVLLSTMAKAFPRCS